ncbi:hypothetical protein ACFSTE_15415 [Aquimarina hainanensis]|uniref:DUF4251 domain-containing protein n=1 Tax=Aquimarina hainanensis TaxID=1578017 RepID=A0ABW5NAF9_9FLAO|nr:hypothetical protein [Aquimarina sp. TRL1]QKX03455.1 hypothetical protein HN014_00480 [Aquimarina sp. TRL1]
MKYLSILVIATFFLSYQGNAKNNMNAPVTKRISNPSDTLKVTHKDMTLFLIRKKYKGEKLDITAKELLKGSEPTYTLEKAYVTHQGNTIDLACSNIYNPWVGEQINEGTKRRISFIEKKSGETIIYAVFSTAADIYAVEWSVKGNTGSRLEMSNSSKFLNKYNH